MRMPARCFVWIVMWMLLSHGAVAVHADISATDLVALGDADYTTRQNTTRKLLADETLTPATIAKAFAASTTVEQKHRLMTLAKHHLLRTERERDFPTPKVEPPQPGVPPHTIPGALGLRHSPVTSDELPQLKKSGVRIRHTLPGFPAHSILEAGDLVLAVQGTPIPVGFTADQISRHFGDLIQMIAAGQSVTLNIYRDGKTLDVKVKLASYTALNQMYQQELDTKYERLWIRFREETLMKSKGK